MSSPASSSTWSISAASTNYDVEIAGGKLIEVVRPNLTRWDQEDFEHGEKVWLSFHACSPAVLAELVRI